MYCRAWLSPCSKTTLRHSRKKPLSSTCTGDPCLYKPKALLLQFLLYKNGAMGTEKLQLSWNTRAICSAAGTSAGSSWSAPFSPLICWCPAQFFAQPSMGTGVGIVSANTTPFRPWELQIDTRGFSSFPVIFSRAGKHACIHDHVFAKRTCSRTENLQGCWAAYLWGVRGWRTKQRALKLGCSPPGGAEERLSWSPGMVHTGALHPPPPDLRATPGNLILKTEALQSSQQEVQESPYPVSVHFAKGTDCILLPPLTSQGAFLLLVICNIF